MDHLLKKYPPVRYILAAGSLLTAFAGVGCKPAGGAPGGPPGDGGYSVQVISEVAETRNITESIRLVGSLTANERVQITSEISGILDEIHFEEGQSVQKGDLLAELNTAKLDAQIREIETEYNLAKLNFERGKALVQDNVISEEEFDQREGRYRNAEAILNLRREQREDALIRAPFDGILGERRVSPGQFISPGQSIALLVDITPMKAEFRVPERFIGQLAVGQSVDISVTAYPEESFTGTVYFMAPEVDRSTRTLLVKARLPNESKRLKPGMFGNLQLNLSIRKNAVVVPESSIFFQGDQKFVYVFQEDGTAGLRPVSTGKRLPGAIEVLSGVAPGERVIAEGHPQKLFPGVALVEADTESFNQPTTEVLQSEAVEG